MADLTVVDARLPGRAAALDVVVRGGRIAAVQPHGSAIDGLAIEAGGNLLVPAFVECHLHLDKALLLDRLPGHVGSVGEAIRATAALKASFTRADVLARSETVLRWCVRHGTLAARIHAEVDPMLGLSSVEAALELRERWANVVRIQVVGFPQDGLQRQAGVRELLEESLRMGVDIVGGVTYVDADPVAHVDAVFDLATRFGVPADFHADFADELPTVVAPIIADRTIANGMQGRVLIAHATALGALPRDELAPIADALAHADVSVATLPLTDLYLGGRADGHNVRRCLAPVRTLLEAGVNVACASNNIRNAFTPYGNADLLEVAQVLMAGAHLAAPADVEVVFDMIGPRAARAMGLDGHGIEEGDRADLVLLGAPSVWEAVVGRAEKLAVIAGGRVVSRVETEQAFDLSAVVVREEGH